jgi:hypothetical protein
MICIDQKIIDDLSFVAIKSLSGREMRSCCLLRWSCDLPLIPIMAMTEIVDPIVTSEVFHTFYRARSEVDFAGFVNWRS